MTEAPNNGALYKKNSEVTVSQAAAFPLSLFPPGCLIMKAMREWMGETYCWTKERGLPSVSDVTLSPKQLAFVAALWKAYFIINQTLFDHENKTRLPLVEFTVTHVAIVSMYTSGGIILGNYRAKSFETTQTFQFYGCIFF